MKYISTVSDESNLISEFTKFIDSQERPWMYKWLCVFGTKRCFRRLMDKRYYIGIELEYKIACYNIYRFVRKWHDPSKALGILRMHYIRDMYLFN